MLTTLLTAVSVLSATAHAATSAGGWIAVPGATVVGERQMTTRSVELTIATDSFPAPVAVEVMLPVGYGAERSARWPVTYYLHGTNHDQSTFRAYGGEGLTAGFPSIVVSPRGDSGYWADWYNSGSEGPPRYETFVVDQLIPVVDANFATVPDRAHRAVMGESMGGGGTLQLAARHPDTFAAAAALSGAVDQTYAPQVAVTSASPTLQGGQPDAVFGPYATQAVRARGHNPVDLVGNLRDVDLQVFTGNGIYDPTRGETAVEASAGCALEANIYAENTTLHRALDAASLPHVWRPLPWGCHGVALFRYEIGEALGRLARVFAEPKPQPSTFDFRAVEPTVDVWGWRVTADPDRALEFLTLWGVGDSGLTVSGSGRTTITTPALFRNPDKVVVTQDGRPLATTTDTSGRITFVVDLGPANRQQQYTVGATTPVVSATVRFR